MFLCDGSEKNNGDTFFLQAGNDTDYYEYSVPITWNKWKEITIYQYDISKKNNTPQTWAVDSNGSTTSSYGAMTTVSGSPSFLSIAQFKTGVRTQRPQDQRRGVDKRDVRRESLHQGRRSEEAEP